LPKSANSTTNTTTVNPEQNEALAVARAYLLLHMAAELTESKRIGFHPQE